MMDAIDEAREAITEICNDLESEWVDLQIKQNSADLGLTESTGED